MTQLKDWFADFELWFNELKARKVPKMPLGSSKKIALFIAAAAHVWKTPDQITIEQQWEKIQVFLTEGPTAIEKVFGIAYPTPRGSWSTQEDQIKVTFEICQKIANS